MMDGVVWNSKYFDPKAPDPKQLSPAASMRYIATRKGAHIISVEEETAMELKNNFNYIARRKGVEHVDGERDGLFNAYGKADLNYECEQATQSGSIFWKNVLSLSKEDADRLGYTDVDSFRQLLAKRMPEVAREYSISPQNLVWVAAYHPIDKNGLDHHPHVHVYFYSKDPSEGRMSPERTVKAFEKCRSIFTNDVFAEDAALLKEQRTLARDELRNTLREYRFDNEAADKLGLRDDLRQLARELPAEGRKGAYKYLKPEVKEKVDAILQKMVQLPGVDRAYTAYREAYLKQVKLYNSEDTAIQKRMDAFDKDFFHPTKTNSRRDFHNAILHLARDIEGVDVSLARRDIGEPPRELKHFVGLSAREAVVAAQTDKGYRMWLAQLSSEYGSSELPELMKAAQKENWRDLYHAVRSAADDNPQLRDALVNECRLYLNADEQEQGVLIEGERWYHAGISEETADGVHAEIQRLLYSIRNVTDGTEDYVSRLFYENALDRRVQGWFRIHKDVCDELRSITGAVRYRVDDKRHPCPRAIRDAAYTASTELLIQIADDDPALRKERDLLMVRSIKQTESFDGMDRLLNAALHTAYQQELNGVFVSVLQVRSEHKELFAEIREAATMDGELPAELQAKVRSLITATSSVPIDDRGEYSLTRRLARMLHDEHIGEGLAKEYPSEWSDLKARVELRSDTARLLEDKTVCEALKPFVQAADSKLPRDRVERVLLRQAYTENLSEQMQTFYKLLPDRREAIATLSLQICCGTSFEELTVEQQQKIAVFLPTVSMDEKTRDLFRERALRVIEEQRLQQILSLPQGVLDDVKRHIGMKQDLSALQRDPTVQRLLEPVKAIAQSDLEVADTSEQSLERVLLQQACRDNRRAFVETLYTPEARELFTKQANYIHIGQPLEAMPQEVRHPLERFFISNSDDKGDELMAREIERRLYNERFRALERSPDVRQILSEYIRDPHHRSLLERGVRFDELTPADRAAVSSSRSWIGNREISTYASEHPEDVDRAFYRAAQQQMHEEQRVEHGARGLLGGLITATAIARQAMMQHAQDQKMRDREGQREECGRNKKKKRPKTQQDRARREDPMQP